eukprot:27547-Eustigmatos_ZCMA.PRE.1
MSGFVKTVRIEHPELKVQHLDLAADVASVESQVDALLELVGGRVALPELEVEIALRQQTVIVPRLVPSSVQLNKHA